VRYLGDEATFRGVRREREYTHAATLRIMLALLFLVLALGVFQAGSFSVRGMVVSRPRGVIGLATRLQAVKPDLFSDDLFDEDEGAAGAAPSDSKKGGDKEAPKKVYLDQKWKLNSEDAKDFKGFPKKGAAEGGAAAAGDSLKPPESVPAFALMYKFRKEYVDVSVDSVLADHKGHAAKFKRLLNTEIIGMGKSKGVVLLWAGFSEGDKDETKSDIMKFLEDDPFITKDIVENWDLIDLQKSAADKSLPASSSK